MGNSSLVSNKFFEYFAIFLTICQISCVPLLANEDIYTFIIRLSIILFFIFFIPNLKRDLNFIGFIYCAAITLGFVFHRIQGLDVKFFSEAMMRIVPVLIISHYRFNESYSNSIARHFILLFFVLECVVAIYEKVTLTHLIDYQSESQAMNANMYLFEDFRSFSLMGHPLYNANIVSMILAFVLCSNTIKIVPKTILVLFGLAAIWAFNSRACMLMWIMIIFYRLFLYGKSMKWILACVGILLIALPSFILYVQKTESLGRLDFDFSDGSSLTRIMAFVIFFEYPWSLNDMIFGGTLLEYPTNGPIGVADYVYIENGFLLDLGYWGFVLGIIKILVEIVISYQVLWRYQLKDKLIIMAALWGVASMNNNTFFTFVMCFFMCAYLAFGLKQKDTSKISSSNEFTKTSLV